MTRQPWHSADELEAMARLRLPPAVYDYIAGGAGDERSLRENRAAFDRLRLRPRVLTGIATATAQTEILGRRLAAPVFVAPMGGPSHELAHPNGVAEMAGGAADAGLGYMVSASSVPTLDLPGEALVCQVYLNDRDQAARLIHDAEERGYIAVCLTVDVPVAALRRRNLRHGTGVADSGGPAQQRGFANPAAYATPTSWRDVEWLRSITALPLLVKGVMTAEDAALAVDAGAAGVVVSNHGGRQLDATLGTIDALVEVVDAVAGKALVLVDGGVQSATDVALSLSLGAQAVGIGKAAMWALAVGGRAGVADYLHSIVVELERTQMMLGVPNVEALGPGHVDRRYSRSLPQEMSRQAPGDREV